MPITLDGQRIIHHGTDATQPTTPKAGDHQYRQRAPAATPVFLQSNIRKQPSQDIAQTSRLSLHKQNQQSKVLRPLN